MIPRCLPVGLLLAVAGYIPAIYGAFACAWLLGIVGGQFPAQQDQGGKDTATAEAS